MRVPEAFSPGSAFVTSPIGCEYVELPDGRAFLLDADGEKLLTVRAMPTRDTLPMTEAEFLACAAERREAARSRPPSTIPTPDPFPAGCSFVPTFGGDEYVRFRDGRWLRFSDDGESLTELPLMKRGPSDGICTCDIPPTRRQPTPCTSPET